MKQKSSRVYVTRVVAQISSIPFDVMRYDGLVPDSEADAHKLERVAYGADKPEDRTIAFRRYSRSPGAPAVDRWHGFSVELISWEPIE